MSGFLGDLDADQKAMLHQIRKSMSDVLTEDDDDRFLLQFLRARSFQEKDVEEMLRAHLRWRKHFGQDFLMHEFKKAELYSKHLRLVVLGFTKEGSLLRLLRLGYSDLKGVIMGNPGLDVETFLAHVLTDDRHLLQMNREKTGISGETTMYIGDFSELNIYDLPWKYTMSVLIRLVKMFEGNFPEHLKAVYLINCPTIMYYVLKALKPFMSEITSSKIHIFGKEGYKDLLLKIIDPAVLPVYLGGTRTDTDDDKICEYLKTKTEKIPETEYFFHSQRLAVTQPGVKEVKIERRKSVNIDVEVTEEDYAILYEVDIQDHDLGIGLFFEEESNSNNNLVCLKPVKRFKGCFSPMVAIHICEKPGKYVMTLDNRYSYFTDKIALYKITLKPPYDKQTSNEE